MRTRVVVATEMNAGGKDCEGCRSRPGFINELTGANIIKNTHKTVVNKWLLNTYITWSALWVIYYSTTLITPNATLTMYNITRCNLIIIHAHH